MIRKNLFAFFLSLLFSAGILKGQMLKPDMKVFSPETYEAHSQIFCGTRDAKGQMWFGTGQYVLHYTGEEWNKYMTSPAMLAFAIEQDRQGRIWVAGQGDLGYFEPSPTDSSGRKRSGPRFVSLLKQIPDSLQDFNIVWDLHTKKDKIFFNGRRILYTYDSSGIDHYRPRKFFYKTFEVDGRIWALDQGHGIYVLDGNGPPDTDSAHIPQGAKLPGSGFFSGMALRGVLEEVPGMTEEGERLMVTQSNGLFRYDPGSGSEPIPIGEEWRNFYKKAALYHAKALDPSRNPWNASLVVSSSRMGCLLLAPDGRPVLRMDRSKGFPTSNVWSTIHGPEGSGILWSATNDGIVRWTPGDPRTFAEEGKLFKGGIEDIVRFKGTLLVATGEGVYRAPSSDPLKTVERSGWEKIAGIDGPILELLKSPDGKVLLAGGGNGSFRITRKEGTLSASSISGDHAFTLSSLPKANGTPLFASGGRNGIILFKGSKEDRIEPLLKVQDLPEGVLTLCAEPRKEDEKSLSLWVSFRTKPPLWIGIEQEALPPFMEQEGKKSIDIGTILEGKIKGMKAHRLPREDLPEGAVYFFHGPEGVLAGSDSGVFRPKAPSSLFRGSKDSSAFFAPDDVLGPLFHKGQGKKDRVKGVYRLSKGRKENYWVSSGKAYQVRLEGSSSPKVDSIPFKGLGLSPVRAFHTDSNGITYIGGDNGLVRYDPRIPKDMKRTYPCLIQKVTSKLEEGHEKEGAKNLDSTLFDRCYRIAAPNDPILPWKRVWEQPDSLIPELPYSMNGVEVHFSAPFYDSREKLEYRYKLKGFEDRWSAWKKETHKEYTNLEEGEYRFIVQAKNVYGTKSLPAEFRFRIEPPWYRTWWAFSSYSLLSISFIFLLVRWNGMRLRKQKERLEGIVRERTQEIRERKEQVEAAHQEINDSLDYARRIQNALLQSKAYVSEHLPEHFILFKPQTRVSGDFYWARERQGHLYVAAVDCTGHGVPGAMMSMLGVSYLNEMLSKEELPEPGEILTELRERVVRELSSEGPEKGAREGMDAAIIRIELDEEKERKEVLFAGANNPLYAVHQGIAEEDLGGLQNLTGIHLSERVQPFKDSMDGIEVKGDPRSVGRDEKGEGAFTTVAMKLRKGDMLYLFSDGYADQFGGPRGKKFRYRPFKELLVELHQRPAQEQKEALNRHFEEWKNASQQEQVDDVCVIGVRI